MTKNKYQFALSTIVFFMGFSLQSFVSQFEHDSDGNDVYIQEQPGLLQCTINIDCDNSYDGRMLFPKEEDHDRFFDNIQD